MQMIPGFNSNVSHEGIEYHVQTEDLGRKNPCVLTLVYRAGAILAREKVNYRDALGDDASEAQIKNFMEEQHRRIMASIQAGQLLEPPPAKPGEPPAPPAPSPPPKPGLPPPDKSLDQLIQEYVRSRTGSKPR